MAWPAQRQSRSISTAVTALSCSCLSFETDLVVFGEQLIGATSPYEARTSPNLQITLFRWFVSQNKCCWSHQNGEFSTFATPLGVTSQSCRRGIQRRRPASITRRTARLKKRSVEQMILTCFCIVHILGKCISRTARLVDESPHCLAADKRRIDRGTPVIYASFPMKSRAPRSRSPRDL